MKAHIGKVELFDCKENESFAIIHVSERKYEED
jgi:hypothetical protein